MHKRSNFRLGFLILTVLFTYCAYTAIGQQSVLYSKKLELQKMQSKLDEEKKTNDELKKQQETINSERYIEKIAREKLGMVKQGERVYVDVGK